MGTIIDIFTWRLQGCYKSRERNTERNIITAISESESEVIHSISFSSAKVHKAREYEEENEVIRNRHQQISFPIFRKLDKSEEDPNCDHSEYDCN